MNPKITVLLPVYNGEKYLAEAIDSVLKQSFTDFELIIINDDSKDKSEEVILSYIDDRIKYIKNERNLNLVATLNKGIELSKGEYLARMDQDDVCHPNRFEEQLNFFRQNPEVGLCSVSYENIGDVTGKRILRTLHNDIVLSLFCHFESHHPSWMMKSTVVKDNNLRYEILYAEDYDFIVRFLNYSKIGNLPNVLMDYRQLSTTTSKKNKDITEKHSRDIRKKLFMNINVSVTDEQLLLYRKLCYHDYSFTFQEVLTLEDFLIKMIDGNNHTAFIDKVWFQNAIRKLWDNLCYNTKGYGIKLLRLYQKSSLLNYGQPEFGNAKFVIKKILYL